jgi:superfamily II RNA helicase
MAEVQGLEKAHGLADLTRGPDFGLSGIVQRWAEGEEFDAVLSRTSLAPGDLVRVLRMSIQMLRQAYHALPGADPVARTLREARLRLDRDVVDARRQLELG